MHSNSNMKTEERALVSTKIKQKTYINPFECFVAAATG